MTTPTSETIDLNDCEREPIHIPGAIQPHGLLLRLSEPELSITHVSANVSNFLSIQPEQLLGKPLAEIIDEQQIDALLTKLAEPELERHNPLQISIKGNSQEKSFFEGIAHRFKGSLILELEPRLHDSPVGFSDFYHQAKESVQRLRACKTLKSLFDVAVDEVRKITGFDRVLIYRFDEDWNGKVIAEAKKGPQVASYLGLHFPASDIPKQARDLYALNRLRIIPAADHTPSALLSTDKHSVEPVDLSMAVLRAVSPVHLEYLRNMEVSASMSVSLVKSDRLWGLITCTHESGALYLPYDVRAVCDFIGEIISSLLPSLEYEEDSGYRVNLFSVQSRLLQRMSRAHDFIDGLLGDENSFLELANATGGAVYFAGKLHVVGDVPSDTILQEIVDWLSKQQIQDVLCETSLPISLPSVESAKDKACGLVAFSISRAQANYFIWFRPEVIQTVSWGGNPTKISGGEGLTGRIHPRKSFELWKETVRFKSLPWKQEELQAVSALRSSIIEIVLQRTERLSHLNAELERSNSELDSFAYAASHDLKEPLRGIYNYVNLVLRDDGDKLPLESSTRLATVSRLTQRMEDLINSLLHYAQIGRAEIFMRKTDINEVVNQALESVRNRIEEEHVDIRIAKKLPVITCDRVQMIEVFTNLFSNAIKYNLSEHKVIEVSFLPNPEPGFYPIFCVKDNGIGIDATHYQSIFKIFKRLHPKEHFGGGTGTGLTIAQKVIERHGGSIWAESEVGIGTSFFFTIAEGKRNEE